MKSEKQMMQFILGKWISKPVHVAAKLGIADLLAEKSKSIEELAERTDTLPSPLYRMMRALAGVGIFAETDNRVFINTPLSECLMEGKLRSASLMFHSDWHDIMWDNLLYSIQTGKPAFEKVQGASAFDWFGKNPEQAELFHKANAFKSASSHGIIAETYDFNDIKTITDVGGGTGSLMIEILKAYPHLKGIVAELPEVIEQVKETIMQNDLKNRISAVECDFFKEIPGDSDAYLLSHVLHDWPDDKCIKILRNCRKVDAKLLIIEAVIPAGNTFSVSKLLDLEVLLMGGGCERSEEEFRRLLKKAGFRMSQVIHTQESISIIEGIPE